MVMGHLLQVAQDAGFELLAKNVAESARKARVHLVPQVGSPASSGSTSVESLTPREDEVLQLLATGATNRQIANQLFISDKTASVHVSRILQKLGVAGRKEVISSLESRRRSGAMPA
jgi:DNA-binding NarL/FixJ family response regulator